MILSARKIYAELSGKPRLAEVSLDLNPGEILTVIGPNGSGKTTLLRALLGQIESEGTILWFDTPIRLLRLRDLAKQVAYMPQTPTYDPNDSVIEVLRLGRSPHQGLMGLETDEDDRVIQEIAQSLELTDLLDRPMATLSGGQRQRVFLGRCLAQSPKALLLDEPATFLDLRHQVELYKLLKKLAIEKQIAVLMASHDLNLAATHADRAVVLKEGEVVAAGAIDEVMTSEIMSRAFDIPMKRIESDGVVQIAVVG